MRRREFITLVGGALAAWPLCGRAQQSDRVRHIGVLMNLAERDPEAQQRAKALESGLQRLGWNQGRNLKIAYRWARHDGDLRTQAAELVAMQPDVILSNTTPALMALRQETRTVPIVFVQVHDPVAQGFVASLAHPGGNITGFSAYESSIGGKWLELLKEVAPRVLRVGLLFNPNTALCRLLLPSVEAAASSFATAVIRIPCFRHVLLRAIPVGYDRCKSLAINSLHIRHDPFAHPADSHACEPTGIHKGTHSLGRYH
jgi:putative ABC transport system substrate-binding protein